MKKILLIAIPVIAIIVFMKWDGGSGDGCPFCENNPCTCTAPEDTENDELKKATTGMVIIDNSWSMAGYFKKDECKELVGVVSDLVHYTDKGELRFYGETKGTTNVTAKIIEQNKFSGTSDLVKMLNDNSNPAPDSITFFITDGIPSVKYTASALKDIQHTIAKNMNPKCGYSIYRLVASYNGKYYSEVKRTSAQRKIEKRPYFVFVIGDPKAVRDFKKNNKLDATHEAHFNLHSAHKGMHLNPDKSVFTGPSDKDKNVYALMSNEEMKFKAKLPACLASDEDFIEKHAKVLFNGTEIEVKDLEVDDDKLEFEIPYDTQIEKLFGGNTLHEIRVVVKNDITELCQTSNDDDSDTLKDGSDTDNTTFGLKYIVEGLLEGATDNNLLDLTLKFQK